MSHDDPRRHDSAWWDPHHQCRVYRTWIWGYRWQDSQTRRKNRKRINPYLLLLQSALILEPSNHFTITSLLSFRRRRNLFQNHLLRIHVSKSKILKKNGSLQDDKKETHKQSSMWIWDTMPSWGYRPKKPLTKAQIHKLQEAYSRADEITAEVKEKEQEEQRQVEWETEKLLGLI